MFDVHWVPLHRGGFGPYRDSDVFREWQPRFVKVVWDGETVPYLEDIPPTAQIVVRNYPLSEQFHNGLNLGNQRTPMDRHAELPQNGSGRDEYQFGALDMPELPAERATLPTPEQAAEVYVQNADAVARYCAAHGVGRERLLFEGPNEYPVWVHGYEGLARLEAARLRGLHRIGLRGVAINLGVGWPGNDGKDRPPLWEWARPVINEFANGDYLGLHEYWAYNGPRENWRWWAGRLLQCPWRVPILVTECGIDGGVLGPTEAKKGWWDLPEPGLDNKAERYLNELWEYAGLLRADGRTQGLFIYSYDGNRQDWGRFDIRIEAFIGRFLERIKRQGMPQPGELQPPTPPPQPPPQPSQPLERVLREAAEANDVLRVNPDAALAKAGLAQGLWPTSNEFAVTVDGVRYVAQRFRDPRGKAVRVLYCRDGVWGKVYRLEY